tara:strand:+ start:674 stop:2974 length:2301 start_codon:yes stop_codon:yes gene_type:complete
MSNTPSGLQTDRFVQSFTKSTGKNTVYTTEDFVNTTVRNYLNTSSGVNIRIGNGTCISTVVTGTTETIVSVGLCAGLNNLNDVSAASTPGYYLQYDGTTGNWISAPGLSITDASITDLNDVINTPTNNSILFCANGTSLFFKEDNSIEIDNLQALPERGISIQKNSSYPYQANIQTRFLNFPTATSDSAGDYYTFTDSSGITRKILKSQISASDFRNFGPAVITNAVAAFSASNSMTGGYASGLSYNGLGHYNLNLSNYLSGAGGILPISKGGMGSSTSNGARINLGLSYNFSERGTCYVYDIMGFTHPSFRETLEGDNIRLGSTIASGKTVSSGGSSYFDVDSNYYYIVDSNTGVCYQVDITVAAAGGSVTSFTIPSIANGTNFLYNNFGSSIYLLDTTTTGPSPFAEVSISGLRHSYITYGTGTETSLNFTNNYGIRFGSCVTQVKTGPGPGDWEDINRRPAIQELQNVTLPAANFSHGNILIYNGTCFQPYTITGAINIGPSGNAVLATGGICVNAVNFPGPIDFNDLTGTTGRVQNQLDSKLFYDGPTRGANTPGLLILEGGSSTETLTAIRNAFMDSPQIPISVPPNHDGISFLNVSSAFEEISTYNGSDITNLNTCLIDTSQGAPTGPIGTRYTLPNFLDLITTGAGGIVSGSSTNALQIAVESLPDLPGAYTKQANMGDYIGVGPCINRGIQPNHRIELKNLLSVPSFSSTTDADGIGYYFTGALGVFPNPTTPGGVSFLGVATGNGTSWYGVSFTSIF